ncbi:MAG: NAD-dependent protein deacylase [OM182 bacterium]|nr:NAD-dependent protein deacylase [OM182 bacterium]
MQNSNAHASRPRSVVVLTGAGISAESGIQTFRASDGLWEEHRIEDVASPEGFARNPTLVYDFYNQRRRQVQAAAITPNAAHTALARFEHDLVQAGGEFLLVTQNVDNLHERAGSQALSHMHGELLKSRCVHSGLVFDWRQDLGFDSVCRCCQQKGNLRPHIVWFGEMPLGMSQIEAALARCDLFVSIGTSGNVYPAAGFHYLAKQAGATTVELNLDRTGSVFDEHHYGQATQIVPTFFSNLA